MVENKPILKLSNIKVYEIQQPIFQLDPVNFKTLHKMRFNIGYSVSTFFSDTLNEQSFLEKNNFYKTINEYSLWFRLGKSNRAAVIFIDKQEFFPIAEKVNKILKF